MKFCLVVLGLGSVVALYFISRAASQWYTKTHLSEGWLKAQSKREGRDGVEQVCIQAWPIDKFTNEQSWRNTRKLRRSV